MPGRQRLATELPDLQRALDALGVVRRQAGGGDGVHALQLGVQGRPAFAGRAGIDGGADGSLPEAQRAELRRAKLGFVFQAFHLLPHLSVAENVELPLRLLGRPDPRRVESLLQSVGLGGLGGRSPAQLSGGQLQRVALARALVHRPLLILADEPTGNLDPATAERMLDVLLAQVRAEGAACLLVTHSAAAAARADRVLRLTPLGIDS